MTDVLMPRLSDSMEEATIVQWLVEDGAEVAAGDPLAEIETDKATMTYEADGAGVLRRLVEEGDAVAVGAPMARLLAPGEEGGVADGGAGGGNAEVAQGDDAPAISGEDAALVGVGAATDAAANASVPASVGGAPSANGASGASGAPASADGAAPAGGDAPGGVAARHPRTGRILASPLARRVASGLGVDLSAVVGSGPRGRIVRRDVEAARAGGAAAGANGVGADRRPPAPTPAGAAGGEPRGAVTVVTPTRIQGVIARRMVQAQTTIPDFQVRTEADATDLLALRKDLRAQTGAAPSVNDFVIRACGLALREHPQANAAQVGNEWHRYARINVGMAVAGEGTLVVPTVFDADRRPVTEIARETRALAEKVREGRITPAELDGGTFTVSNLGMFGVTSFTAVVNPGQAAILAVGTAVERVTLVDGVPRARQVMELSLSCDHRILYGADAARLLATIRERLETPLGLLA